MCKLPHLRAGRAGQVEKRGGKRKLQAEKTIQPSENLCLGRCVSLKKQKSSAAKRIGK